MRNQLYPVITALDDWTFDLKVFRTYTVRGQHSPCPELGQKIRRPLEGSNEVYEVSSVVDSSLWEIEAHLISLEKEVPFQKLQEKET